MSGSKVRKVHVDGQEWKYTLRHGLGSGKVRIFFPDGTLAEEVAHHTLLGTTATTLVNARDDLRTYHTRDDSLSITPAVVKRYIEEHLKAVWH